MHILLRYYESAGATREAKVKETLQTMGASIMLGGLSTFLGVIPLAFSTSAILRTVFTSFLAMVTLGVLHGLVLLPVVLSLVGPTVCIAHRNPEHELDDNEEEDMTGALYDSPSKSVKQLCLNNTVETASLPSPSATGSESNSVSEETNQEGVCSGAFTTTNEVSALMGDASITTDDSSIGPLKEALDTTNSETSQSTQIMQSFSDESIPSDVEGGQSSSIDRPQINEASQEDVAISDEADNSCIPNEHITETNERQPVDVVTDFDPFVNVHKDRYFGNDEIKDPRLTIGTKPRNTANENDEDDIDGNSIIDESASC